MTTTTPKKMSRTAIRKAMREITIKTKVNVIFHGKLVVAELHKANSEYLYLKHDCSGMDRHSGNDGIARFDTDYRVEDGTITHLSVYVSHSSYSSSSSAVNTSELDKLVIDDEAREEIEAVLKQQKFGKKIFEDWGLGDVIEYGKGMTMLFWGPPGTGKTFGANCIAKALKKELLVVSSAEIQSSEPGGACRAIKAAFANAKSAGKVLFFDECDSLITDRTNVGMILGSEINTLLTEIEQFEGVCILATNRVDTLDAALERRISLIQEFPEPDEAQRTLIWEKIVPKKMPVESGITAEWLAKSKLTGGQIKNVLLAAARRAVSDNADCVTKDHFENAIDKIRLSSGLMAKHPGQNAKIRDVGVSEGTDKKRKKVIIPGTTTTKTATSKKTTTKKATTKTTKK